MYPVQFVRGFQEVYDKELYAQYISIRKYVGVYINDMRGNSTCAAVSH